MSRQGAVAANKREHLAACLGQCVPKGAKVALCVDPEGDLDGEGTIADPSGRAFRVVTYREDDLAFRLRLRELEGGGVSASFPVLVRIARPELVDPDHRIDVSPILDVLARVEGTPIDLRTDAVVTHHTEPVVWPAELQLNAHRISADLRSFVGGYHRLRSAIGKGRPLARYHIAAAIVLGAHSGIEYSELDLPTAYPEAAVARALALTARHQVAAGDRDLLWEAIAGTSHHEAEPLLGHWKALPDGEAARLVVFTSFLASCDVTNAALLLAGRGWFSAPIDVLVDSLPSVVQHLRERPEDWSALCASVDRDTPVATALDAVALITPSRAPETWLALVREDSPRCIAHALALGYLDDRTRSAEVPELGLPRTLPDWAASGLSSWSVAHVDSSHEERAVALLRLIHRVERIQSRLATAPIGAAEFDDALDGYAATDECRLELLWALACKDLDSLDDPKLISRLRHVLGCLERAIDKRLDETDARLADAIVAAPETYRRHARSSARFLAPRARAAAGRGHRFFVWLFDGMRWDTWVDVVRPLLEGAFAIEEEVPLLAPVPTYTRFARTSVFAGAYPQDWKGLRGGFTYNEGELAARSFGIASQREMEADLLFLTHSDTSEAKDKFRSEKPRRFNCLVFNISDDNIHDAQGDLREINDAIRAKVERDVLPEMRRLVEANDVVVVTSDHGFVALRRDQALPAPVHPNVRRRYALAHEELAGATVPFSDQRDVASTTCAVGRSWYSNERTRYDRYSHGGVSFAEIVVPGVVLRRVTATETARIEVVAPDVLDAREDDTIDVAVTVRNRGARSATIRVTTAGAPAQQRDLAKGKEIAFSAQLKATLALRLVDVRVESRDSDGAFRPVPGGVRQIPVRVTARKDKVEFGKALEAFDDLDD